MLVLSRKPVDKVQIGKHISLTIVEIQNNRVLIGIDAPEEISILRKELRRPSTTADEDGDIHKEFRHAAGNS